VPYRITHGDEIRILGRIKKGFKSINEILRRGSRKFFDIMSKYKLWSEIKIYNVE
jgi:hypothetical protein